MRLQMVDRENPKQVAIAYGSLGDVMSTLSPFRINLNVGSSKLFRRVRSWFEEQRRLDCQTLGPKSQPHCKFAAYIMRIEERDNSSLRISLEVMGIPQWFVRE